MTKDELLSKCTDILHQSFDVPLADLTPAARLKEDLDIDSIDAVDLLVRLKPVVGRRLQPEAFKEVRTVQDVVDALHAVLQAPPA